MIDSTLKSILDKDPKASIATRGYYTNYPMKAYAVKNDCALVVGFTDQVWLHCIGRNEKDMRALIKEYEGLSKYYYSVEEWIIPLIHEIGEEEWRMETVRYMLDDAAGMPKPTNPIVPLSPDDTDYIFEHSDYRDYTDTGYIRDRLERDISAAIAVDGKPVAWGLTHDDGAMGFLHVLPEHRGKGYGRDVVLALIDMISKEGKPVYCNIVPGNTPAIKLVESLGFKPDRKIFWIKLK